MIMKRAIILAALVVTALSCTKKVDIPKDPDVDVSGRTQIKATVGNYSGQEFIWSSKVKVGIYDSKGNSNVLYTPLSEYSGKSGAAVLYGMNISGAVKAYMPWTETGYPCIADGRQPVKSYQQWYPSADEHVVGNIVMVAAADEDDSLDFRYDGGLTGLMHLTLKFDAPGIVREMMVYNLHGLLSGNVATDAAVEPPVIDGKPYVKISGIGRACSESDPLEIWTIVPAGKYSHLSVAAYFTSSAASFSVTDVITVNPGGVSDIVLTEEMSDGGIQDFDIINGEYK